MNSVWCMTSGFLLGFLVVFWVVRFSVDPWILCVTTSQTVYKFLFNTVFLPRIFAAVCDSSGTSDVVESSRAERK